MWPFLLVTIKKIYFLLIPILLIKLSILRHGKFVDNKAKFCYLVVLNDKFLTRLAAALIPQND